MIPYLGYFINPENRIIAVQPVIWTPTWQPVFAFNYKMITQIKQ